jgi:carbonic anhydrase
MQKLIQGIHEFREQGFRSQKELYERLAKGQSPETLFITCSDSRINPAALTNTAPGDLFILRNAGNIVPAFSGTPTGEAATIEYAVEVLGVKDIIVCGHSHCGAMAGLLNPASLEKLPTVAGWLKNAAAIKRIVENNYKDLDDAAKLKVAIQENSLVQLENLRTHPSVAARVAAGSLRLHAWVYRFETGDVFAFDPATGQYGVPGITTNGDASQQRQLAVNPAQAAQDEAA